jgi:hypothetical protein
VGVGVAVVVLLACGMEVDPPPPPVERRVYPLPGVELPVAIDALPFDVLPCERRVESVGGGVKRTVLLTPGESLQYVKKLTGCRMGKVYVGIPCDRVPPYARLTDDKSRLVAIKEIELVRVRCCADCDMAAWRGAAALCSSSCRCRIRHAVGAVCARGA